MAYSNGSVRRNFGNRPFDEHFCFFIQDFIVGDCVDVMVNGEKLRGYVTGVNTADNYVLWQDVVGTVRKAVMNDIRYLAPFNGALFNNQEENESTI